MKVTNTKRARLAIQAPPGDWSEPRYFDVRALARDVEVPPRFQASPALLGLLASGDLVLSVDDAPAQHSSPAAPAAPSPASSSPGLLNDSAPAPVRRVRRAFAKSLASSSPIAAADDDAGDPSID